MNEEGKEKFLKFVEDGKRREYIRRKVKKYKETAELISIRDLMLARYKHEQKQKAKQ